MNGGQAALAVLVVAGIGLTALLLRPDAPLRAPGRGPLGHSAGLVLLLALACLFAGLMASRRYRERLDARLDDRRLDPAEQQLSDTVRRTLAVLTVALPLFVLVLHRFGTRHGGGSGRKSAPTPTGTRGSVPPSPTAGHAPHWVTYTGATIGLLVALVLVTLAAWVLWRLLRRPVRGRYEATYDTSDEEQERLARAVDSGRRALLDGDDARTAVIACYLAMETSLAASGVARLASDSPQDLLERASSGCLLTGGAAGALTVLFREARYSTHPMDDGHRDRAAAALAEIAAQLDQPGAARARTAEATS